MAVNCERLGIPWKTARQADSNPKYLKRTRADLMMPCAEYQHFIRARVAHSISSFFERREISAKIYIIN